MMIEKRADQFWIVTFLLNLMPWALHIIRNTLLYNMERSEWNKWFPITAQRFPTGAWTKKKIDREKERKKKTAEDVSDDCLSINSLNPII